MFVNFLSRSTHLIFSMILFISWWLSLWGMFFIFAFAYAALWFLFRRQRRQDINTENEIDGAVFSPVNGKIQEISDNIDTPFFGKQTRYIRILVAPWNEYSILLPVSSEVQDFHFNPVSGPFRWWAPDSGLIEKSLGVCLTLKTKARDTIGVQFLRCFSGKWPKLSVVPGDRGTALSRIGHYPLGGTALVYIPENYEIIIENTEEVVAGVTILATPKKISRGVSSNHVAES